jgi:DNA-directed RNA polymerase specialized sigma subunit
VAEVRAQLVRQLVAYPDITLTDIGFLVGVSKSGVYRILERKG